MHTPTLLLKQSRLSADYKQDDLLLVIIIQFLVLRSG